MNEREIFEQAIGIHNVNQRQAFLNQACGADVALHQRLDELLASHDQASGFLKVPVVDQIPSTPMSGQQPTVQTSQMGGATDAGAAQDDDDEDPGAVDLSFLQPSTRPGSIGRLGHYEILEVLGKGAFGIVFKAFDEKLHRQVAIKAMNPQLASTSPPRKRFLREARSVAALKHENVIQIYSVEEQPLPYLAMEFVDGQTLQQKLGDSGPLEVPEILHLGRQIAAGLAAAHEKGLIHRDIKPGNILLESGAEQKVKITDFGLARAADDATMTRTGTIAGTPMYMAPEQAMGQTLDHRGDLFSLGSVLYQMTCGRPPFRGANAMAVLKRVVDESPRPIQDILPQAPDWMCAIIEKLHAKNPDERYQTAKEVADVLARCQNELQVNSKVTSAPLRRKASAVVAQPAATADANLPAKPSSRRPLVAAAAAVILLIGGLAVTGVTQLFRRPNNEPFPFAGSDVEPDGVIEPSQIADADRRAAEWVLSLGEGNHVSVTVGPDFKQETRVNRVAELPADPFRLTYVQVSSNAVELRPDAFDCLKSTRHVALLGLSGKAITNEVLQRLAGMPEVQHVSFSNPTANSEGLVHLQTMPKLNLLTFSKTTLTEEGFTALAAIPQLKTVRFSGGQVTKEGLAILCGRRELKGLAFSFGSLNVETISALRDASQLAELWLNDLVIGDAELEHLKSCHGLKALTIKNLKVTEAGVKKLSAALPACRIEWDGGVIEPKSSADPTRSLAEWVLGKGGSVVVTPARRIGKAIDLPAEPFTIAIVDLSNCQFESQEELTRFATLTVGPSGLIVYASHTNLDDEGLGHLVKCRAVTRLYMESTKVTDEGLSAIEQLPRLLSLHLPSQISDAGLQHVANCPTLEHLSVASCKVTDSGFAQLKSLTKLKAVYVLATDVSLAGLAMTLKDSPLEVIVADVDREADLERLSQWPKLNWFTSNSPEVGDTGLAHLANQPELQTLILKNVRTTDAGYKPLKQLKKLQILGITQSTSLGDGALTTLGDMPQLRSLTLQNTSLTDAGLKELEKLKDLASLSLKGTKVTEAGVKKLSAALPGCTIEWAGGVIVPTITVDRPLQGPTSSADHRP